MPYRRKDSPIGWANFTDSHGRRIRRSTGTSSIRKAKELEAKWRHETHKQKKWGEQPEWVYDQLMLDHLRATQSQKRSAARDRDITKHLTHALRGGVLNSLCATDIKTYIEKRRSEKARRNGRFQTQSQEGNPGKARMGIRDFRPHDLRHTCAAWRVRSGVDLARVRDLLRHKSVQMTERYAHLAPHNVRSIVPWSE